MMPTHSDVVLEAPRPYLSFEPFSLALMRMHHLQLNSNDQNFPDVNSNVSILCVPTGNISSYRIPRSLSPITSISSSL